MMQKCVNPSPHSLIGFLPPQWSDIQILISIQEDLSPSPVSGISVENLPAIYVEDTEPRLLAIETIKNVVLFHGFLVVIVVLDRSDGFIHGDMEIILFGVSASLRISGSESTQSHPWVDETLCAEDSDTSVKWKETGERRTLKSLPKEEYHGIFSHPIRFLYTDIFSMGAREIITKDVSLERIWRRSGTWSATKEQAKSNHDQH